MAYGRVCLLAGVALVPLPARAELPRVAVIVEGAAREQDAALVELAVTRALGEKALLVDDAKLRAQRAPGPNLTTDEAARELRLALDAQRVVLVHLKRQGKDLYLVTVQAVDASGVHKRFGNAPATGLASTAVRLVEELPALPESKAVPPGPVPPGPVTPGAAVLPGPVPLPAASEPAKPETGEIGLEAPNRSTMPVPHTPYKRRHPYGMLVGGAVSFLFLYFATVGVAANYDSYNPNASRMGYIPLAGPFLARERLNDKDQRDGGDPGLLVDGVLQVVSFGLLAGGIVWCAVGEKVPVRRDSVRVRPHPTGLQVTW